MKKLFFLLLFLICSSQGLCQEAQQMGLDHQMLQQFLQTEEESFDFEEWIIAFTAAASQDLQNKRIDKRAFVLSINKMVQDADAFLQQESFREKKLQGLNQFIFSEYGFQVDRSSLFESALDALLFNNVLEERHGYCLSLSLVYLMIADSLDIPMVGVMTPGHFFVRYQGEAEAVNIETTDSGKSFDDSYYLADYMNGFQDDVSLKDLTLKQVAAVYLANLSTHYKLQGHHDKTVEILKTCMQLLPNRASFYVNLGNVYERSRKFEKSFFAYQKALSLNPYLCEAHYNLGLLHFLYTKRENNARRHGLIAARLGCRLHPEFEAFLLRK